MNILLKREDFSAIRYDLRLGNASLDFAGETEPFSLSYSQIVDFVITMDAREKQYFTMTCTGGMYEGRILSPNDIRQFTEALKVKLDGIVQIDIHIR